MYYGIKFSAMSTAFPSQPLCGPPGFHVNKHSSHGSVDSLLVHASYLTTLSEPGRVDRGQGNDV